MSDDKQPIVFGKTFICKRCGHVAQHKSYFRVAATPGQNDAYTGEFCEYCVPGSMLGALADMTFGSAQETR